MYPLQRGGCSNIIFDPIVTVLISPDCDRRNANNQTDEDKLRQPILNPMAKESGVDPAQEDADMRR